MYSKVKAAVRFNSNMNDKINQFDSNIDGLFTVNDLKVCLFTLVCRRRSFI